MSLLLLCFSFLMGCGLGMLPMVCARFLRAVNETRLWCDGCCRRKHIAGEPDHDDVCPVVYSGFIFVMKPNARLKLFIEFNYLRTASISAIRLFPSSQYGGIFFKRTSSCLFPLHVLPALSE